MDGKNAYIILNIDTKNPIELSEFVGSFTSLARQYERFIKEEYPDLSKETKVYVREVRSGSIEADILPWLFGGSGAAGAAWVISQIDKIQILEKFLKRFKGTFDSLKNGKPPKELDTVSELKEWANTVSAIATDPNGSKTLSLATYENGKTQTRAAFKFDSKDARKAQKTIDTKLMEMGVKKHPEQERALMIYTRADIHDAKKGKKSGEKVIINSISPNPLSIMYVSGLAEGQIKQEIRTAEFPFKTGFVVDVYIETNAAGKPLAYAVTNFHNTIDIDD